jgi:hypothetical protein
LSFHAENPYKRGKSKLVANLILDGKSNDDIRDYWVVNNLEERLGRLNSDLLHNTRSELKSKGLLDDYGLPIQKPEPAPIKESQPIPIPSQTESPVEKRGVESPSEATPIEESGELKLRPEWDLLTLDQIGHITDPVLRTRILNYKTEKNKLKQELKPEYATRGEIDLLRTDVSAKMGDIQETLNTLIKKFDDPEPSEEENLEPEEEEETEEEAPPPKRVPRLATAVNRLEAEQETEPPQEGSDDDLIEVEGVVIIRKHIGFTAKSVMYYEIDKVGGFQGNLADYVNSCIEDAHKGRDIGLAVVERKMIK